MKKICRVIFVLLLLASYEVNAQYFPNLKREIPEVVKGYDSVLLYYYLPTNWGPDEINIVGYGIKGKKVFKVDIVFTAKIVGYANDKIQFKSLNKTVVTDYAKCDSIRTIRFSSIIDFDNDSLNRKSSDSIIGDTNISINVRDGMNYCLFTKFRENYYFAQSYEPESYQLYGPTKDRAKFIKIERMLESLLSSK